MLTTTVDGLWALQILTGIEVVAPELGLRPILPSVETPQMALLHPITAELQAAGVIDDSGTVDPIVVEWLTVLARRDVALVIQARSPQRGDEPDRAILARYAQWWVVLERSKGVIRIGGAGTSTAEGAASAIISSQIERLCGVSIPAPLRPVTVDADALLADVKSQETLRAFLMNRRLDGDQLQILMMAADPKRSAQASIVALQSGVETGRPSRTYIEQTVVTVIDTPDGRLVAEHLVSGGKKWMVIAPGAGSNIADAINRMVRRLPANQEWFSYRKVV
ncbi:ESX secretion-associated protein EspG [Mycobacterium xenopi]|uniref:ESX-2 secretion-associated protein EspG2 n=1 Tax=Mycobacterium xenopi TaxID=1789 RepID=A0AAD1GWW6_MYCXE|nr:ESX secretion-associated protein EspG [Mycobacterium xenopi]MDA3638676.1 ESX secretion-associated protein EspG [Mycobacterium xenopi]MDA3656904.1 ESX secretion-associated protein EspG [Mycobacterium xenopi]MDA3662356.1 ESX secretion-associated protein EspG [Mycobacterium xenopi]ORX10791.1 secretion protein EspG [Mycobacterium xenopi]SPX94274.1 Putative ESX-2 secretion-associated protein EspG2 [Mycobacterium xenopi]